MLGRLVFGVERGVAKVASAESTARFADEIAKALSKDIEVFGAGPVKTLRGVDAESVANLLRNEPIKYSTRLRDSMSLSSVGRLRFGYVEDGSGGAIHVIERTHPKETQRTFELAAQELHAHGPFTTRFPVTVERANGSLVQERIGKSIKDHFNTLDRRFFPEMNIVDDQRSFFEKLMRKPPHGPTRAFWYPKWDQFHHSPSFQEAMKHPGVHDQVEQAFVERLIWGDSDSHAGNIAISALRGQVRAANIDVELAFGHSPRPSNPMVGYFGLKPVSDQTLGKVDQFLTTFDSARGRSIIRGAKLSDESGSAMLQRARWFLEQRQFPEGDFFVLR